MARVSLDVLVDSGLICSQHHDGLCDSERLWMSFDRYIETLHPESNVDGYSEKVSTSFKDGRMRSQRRLIACLASS